MVPVQLPRLARSRNSQDACMHALLSRALCVRVCKDACLCVYILCAMTQAYKCLFGVMRVLVYFFFFWLGVGLVGSDAGCFEGWSRFCTTNCGTIGFRGCDQHVDPKRMGPNLDSLGCSIGKRWLVLRDIPECRGFLLFLCVSNLVASC